MQMTRFFSALLVGLAVITAFASFTTGCAGGKKSGAKGVSGQGPFPVPNPPPPGQNNPTTPPSPPTVPSSEDPQEVKKNTVFANQQIDEISRFRNPQTFIVDKTKPGHFAGRFVGVSGSANVLENMVLFDANYKDGNGKHNGNPANGGRSLSGGKAFQMVLTVTALDQDDWTFFSSGQKVPETFKAYVMQPLGNELYQVQVQTPAYGRYIINVFRVAASEVQAVQAANNTPPNDWFPFGLPENSGFDVQNPPRGIVCYARQENGVNKFGIIHDGSQNLPNDAVQDWPSPNPGSSSGGSSSGGSSGGGGTNALPVIGSITVAPVASGSASAIHSGFTPIVTVPSSDPDSATLSTLLQHTSGTTGSGPLGISSVTANSFALSNLLVTQRTTIELTATVSDGIASVQSKINVDVIIPNHFSDIAEVSTKTISRITDKPNTVAMVGLRTRSDGFGAFAFNLNPVKADGTPWTGPSDGIAYLQCWFKFGPRIGNTANTIQAGDVPHAQPNGNVQGGFNPVANVGNVGDRYEFRVPMSALQGTNMYVIFSRNNGADFAQTVEYDDFWAESKGYAITLNTSNKFEFNRADPATDAFLRAGPTNRYEPDGKVTN